MSEYLWQSFELPDRTSGHYHATTPVEPPKGYELSASHVEGGSAVILWRRMAPERYPAMTAAFQQFCVTDLGPGDEVVEPRFTWRGSVTDLVTDLAAVLTLSQLQELAGEAAFAWQAKKRSAEGVGDR